MPNFENPSRRTPKIHFSTEFNQNICSPICGSSLKETEPISYFQVTFKFTHLHFPGNPFYLNEILSADSDETQY